MSCIWNDAYQSGHSVAYFLDTLLRWAPKIRLESVATPWYLTFLTFNLTGINSTPSILDFTPPLFLRLFKITNSEFTGSKQSLFSFIHSYRPIYAEHQLFIVLHTYHYRKIIGEPHHFHSRRYLQLLTSRHNKCSTVWVTKPTPEELWSLLSFLATPPLRSSR